MSRIIMGMSGALALSLISGAAEFARGRDLSPGNLAPTTQALSLSSGASIDAAYPVNRGAKGDRVSALAGSPAATQTVSLKQDDLSDTSVLVLIPVAAARSPAVAPNNPLRRPMVACEPVVSVLTEVAKRLEPGRCVG